MSAARRHDRWVLFAATAVVLTVGSAMVQYPSLDGIAHDEGDPAAPLEVVEFLDFGCPECARFAAEVLPVVKPEFVETGLVRWKYVPFVLGSFRHSGRAAEAAECAAVQASFLPMHDRLLAGQSEWGRARRPDSTFVAYATALGLDRDRFAECLRQEHTRERVKEHRRLARRYGVRGTPTFYFDRRERVEGALPGMTFRELLASRLDAAESLPLSPEKGRPMSAGAPTTVLGVTQAAGR